MELIRPLNIVFYLAVFFAALELGTVIADRPQFPFAATQVELIQAKGLVKVLSVYAREHGERFPATLDELPPGLVPPYESRFHDPRTKEVKAWRYYGGGPVPAPGDDRSGERVVLASPNLVDDHRRLVVYADDAGMYLDEDQYKQQIAKESADRQP